MKTLSQLIAEQDATDFDAVWEYLTTPSIPSRKLVPRWKIKEMCYKAGVWPLLLAATQSEDPEMQGLALTVHAYLTDTDFENLDMDSDEVKQMFGSLVQAGVLTQELSDAIDALADVMETPLEHHNLTPRRYDVIVALREKLESES